MKMVIFDEERTAKISILFSSNKIYATTIKEERTNSRLLNKEESALYLFDMMAVNPNYHFRNNKDQSITIPTFDGYAVIVNFDDSLQTDQGVSIPESMELFRIQGEDKILIRRVHYKNFHQPHGILLRPKEMLFYDVIRERKGEVYLEQFEYNSVVPDFIFELPD